MNQFEEKIITLEKVIDNGYCVGCGGCAFVGNCFMKINDYGEYIPNFETIKENPDIEKVEFVCPSLNPEYNETQLSEIFIQNNVNKSKFIGNHVDIYGGYVKEDNFRDNGTSGGFGTWIGTELLKRGLIDGVIHAKEEKRNNLQDPFFKYGISETLEQISQSAKTKYHVVEMSEVLRIIKKTPNKKYLFIGVPCMVKAIRRIQLIDSDIKQGIAYTMALVCGHLKTINWTLSLAWGAGIKPEDVTKFKYRTKAENIPARAYVFTAYSAEKEIRKDAGNVVGGKFNQGALMLPACNFCDDVVGETADITIGDAWLPQFEVDSKGTNLLIVRNKKISETILQALNQDRIHLERITEKDVLSAQTGAFRMRQEGLAYRLKKADDNKVWRPQKRVIPNESISFVRRLIYKMRANVTTKSRDAFKIALTNNDYSFYKNSMKFQLKLLRIIEILSTFSRIIDRKIKYFQLIKIN